MAGAGYKLFNTGDVLTAAQVNTYLMEQSVMVFADAAARTTALTGVVAEGMLSYLKDTNAVEVYNGSAWVASDDPNAIQNTIVDAKGDLISASAADVPARLAVGNNGDTLLADSSQSTGLRWGNNLGFTAGKNKIINGDFSINQRAFTSTTTTGTYGFDRWSMQLSGATGTYSAETFTLGAAPVAGYEAKNFARLAITTGNDNASLQNRMEDVRTFAGQTVTVSFWAKGTNPTTDGGLYVTLSQVFGAGGSPSAAVNTVSPKFVLTGSWTRYSITLNVPSISGKTLGTTAGTDYLALVFGQSTSVSTDAWTLDLWGVQVEAGSVATAFQTATGTLQGELAACQRYYWRFNSNGTSASVIGQIGIAYNTTDISAVFKCPVTMRTTPTSLDYANVAVLDVAASRTNITSVTILDSSPDNVRATLVGSGFTAQRSYLIYNQSGAAGYVGYSAEL